MSVLALITGATEARPVVVAAQHSARALKADLVLLCYEYSPIAEEVQRVTGVEIDQQELVDHVFKVLDDLVSKLFKETSLATLGSVRLIRHPNPLTAAIEQTRDEDIELVVASAESTVTMPGKLSFQAQLLRHVPCNLALVSTSGHRSSLPRRVL